MPDIDALLALDVSDPASALRFRRGVAELAGYHTEQFKDGYWYLIDPAGRYHPFGNFGAESSCWQHLPLFEMSIDAALTLPLEEGVWYQIECAPWASSQMARVAITVSSRIKEAQPPYESAATTALAVCRAWLRYRAAQSAPVATARDDSEPKPDYRRARGALPWKPGDEPAEKSIRRLRDGEA